MLCVVTLLGRKRGHWLTKPAENEDAAWQQERSPEIPQNICLPVCRGQRKGIVDSSLVNSARFFALNFMNITDVRALFDWPGSKVGNGMSMKMHDSRSTW